MSGEQHTPPGAPGDETAYPGGAAPPGSRVRSFVRRGGRITRAQRRALETLLPRFGIRLAGRPGSPEEGAGPRIEWSAVFGREAPRVLEIGFGTGALLADAAARHPETDFCGIEVHEPGLGHLLLELQRRKLTNVRVIAADALEVLRHDVPPASLDEIWLYFPDPWPKKRHHKRRLVQAPFARAVALALKPGGLFRAATDWEEYARWMREILEGEPLLENLGDESGFVPRSPERPRTRFEQRGVRLGHPVRELLFRRRVEEGLRDPGGEGKARCATGAPARSEPGIEGTRGESGRHGRLPPEGRREESIMGSAPTGPGTPEGPSDTTRGPDTAPAREDFRPGALLPRVREIALAAGEDILEVYDSEFAVEHKDDASPLTEADMRAHRRILGALEALTPDLPILSEESGERPWTERRTWTRYWLVDPLDGTREFVSRNGEFTVNIALIEEHVPILGVVAVPARGLLYYGSVGEGAFREQWAPEERRSPPPGSVEAVPIRARRLRDRPPGSPLVVAGSRSHANEATRRYVERVARELGPVETMALGSALKLCLVAEGQVDLYPRLGPTSEWDTAAAQCVVEQAGGHVTDLELQRLRYNTKESLLNPSFLVFGDDSIDWRRFLD